MAITYTWKVTGIKTQDAGVNKNAVVQTYWQKIGTDANGVQGTFSGATPFNVPETTVAGYVPFEKLTEETVLGWIKKVVVDSYEEHVNAQIAKQIEQQTSGSQEAQLPWVKS